MKTYHLSFYDFQPIDLGIDLLLRLYQQGINTDKLQDKFFATQQKPLWMQKFDALNETFQPIYSILLETSVENDFISQLKLSLSQQHTDNFFQSASAKAFLLFDPRFLSFMLTIEVTMNIREQSITELNQEDAPNLYLSIRELLVEDSAKTPTFKSNWSISIKEQAQYTTEQICQFITGKKLPGGIRIQNNTGNISCVLTAYNKQGEFSYVPDSVQRFFVNTNKKAERLATDYPSIKLSNKIDNTTDLFDFNGRMHTLVINNPKDEFRYLPILFHMQFMWFYIKIISPYFSRKIVSIICNNSQKGKSDLEANIYSIMKRIEVLTIYNEQFKFSIEIDNERIYDRIQNRWSIEKTLKQLQKNAASFGSHISRDNQNTRDKSDQFKNTILAIISIIQILALTSIWNDHLSLIDKTASDSQPFYQPWINLINYNLLPSLFIISSIIGLIFLLTRKK